MQTVRGGVRILFGQEEFQRVPPPPITTARLRLGRHVGARRGDSAHVTCEDSEFANG